MAGKTTKLTKKEKKTVRDLILKTLKDSKFRAEVLRDPNGAAEGLSITDLSKTKLKIILDAAAKIPWVRPPQPVAPPQATSLGTTEVGPIVVDINVFPPR
jgi:hypothetical protein